MRVLVVEDEADLASTLSRALGEAHFAVDIASDGDEAQFMLAEVSYDAVVLDLMVPKRSGWTLLQDLRHAGSRTPVLILTALDAVADRVKALDLGADDYLPKPFAISELVARLRALVRRAGGNPAPVLVVGDITIDRAARLVYRDNVAGRAHRARVLDSRADGPPPRHARDAVGDLRAHLQRGERRVLECHRRAHCRIAPKARDRRSSRPGEARATSSMRESLRVRLVLWYALVLTLVVVLYGGAVVYQSWRSMIAGVDVELEAYAREVTKALKPVEGGRFDLELPTDAATYFFRREGGRPYYVIWGPAGELVDQSDPDLQVGKPGQTADGRREKSLQAAGGATVLVGRDIADLRRAQWGLFLNVALAGIATLAVAIFGGWFVAGRALAPIKRISQTARAMSEGDLNARIAVERTESELEQVASTLNDAFDRLRLAVEQERRFIADASHELRTPISVLRAETEWALDRDRTPQQYKEALTVGRRAALRMQDVVERLLALVRADVAPRCRSPHLWRCGRSSTTW